MEKYKIRFSDEPNKYIITLAIDSIGRVKTRVIQECYNARDIDTKEIPKERIKVNKLEIITAK